MNLLGYVALIMVGLIIGVIIVLFFRFIIFLFTEMKYTKKVPRDPKKIKDFIETNKEFLSDGGKELKIGKEVQEEDDRTFRKFREFEKLRRKATKPSTDLRGSDKRSEGVVDNQGRADIQNRDDESIRNVDDLFEKHFGKTGVSNVPNNDDKGKRKIARRDFK